MLRLKPSNTCPPDKFTFRFVEDGFVATAVTREDWFAAIDKHYKDNGYNQPDNWREIAEDHLCKRLSGEWCDGGDQYSFFNTRFTLDDFLRGTKVLASFVMGGAPVVSPELAEARALICSRCVGNVAVQGCSACSGMANAIAEAKGAQGTKHDHLLRACSICHCANESQVWIPVEYLAKGVTPEMMKQYAQISDCWKFREVSELRQGVDNQPA